MITPEQAENIVRECIGETVSRPGEYRANKSLDQMGIKTPEFLNTLKKIIRSDEQHGVRAYNYRLAAATLDAVSIGTEAGAVEDIIREKAVKNKTLRRKKGVRL